MIVLDSGVILRYLLADDEKLHKKAREIIEKESCLVLPEILAEVVVSLEVLYNVPREDLSAVLVEFLNFDNIHIPDEYIRALFLYGQKEISFLEAVLCAYGRERKVVSFSKKLKNALRSDAIGATLYVVNLRNERRNKRLLNAKERMSIIFARGCNGTVT